MAPASTGRDSNKRKAVMSNAHNTIFMRSNFRDILRIFKIVVIKLIEPKMLLTPAICRLKIAKSTP